MCCVAPTPPRPEFSVICIGLGGVGKTTLLSLLAGEDTADIEPTSGRSGLSYLSSFTGKPGENSPKGCTHTQDNPCKSFVGH